MTLTIEQIPQKEVKAHAKGALKKAEKRRRAV